MLLIDLMSSIFYLLLVMSNTDCSLTSVHAVRDTELVLLPTRLFNALQVLYPTVRMSINPTVHPPKRWRFS
jgi:hypothetical protein